MKDVAYKPSSKYTKLVEADYISPSNIPITVDTQQTFRGSTSADGTYIVLTVPSGEEWYLNFVCLTTFDMDPALSNFKCELRIVGPQHYIIANLTYEINSLSIAFNNSVQILEGQSVDVYLDNMHSAASWTVIITKRKKIS